MGKWFFLLVFLLSFDCAVLAQNKKKLNSDLLRCVEVKHKAYELYNRIMNNELDTTNFGTMAVLYSEDTLTAVNRGRSRDYMLSGFDEKVVNVIKKMHTGDISMPIETSKGFYIIRLYGRKHKGYKIQEIFVKY